MKVADCGWYCRTGERGEASLEGHRRRGRGDYLTVPEARVERPVLVGERLAGADVHRACLALVGDVEEHVSALGHAQGKHRPAELELVGTLREPTKRRLDVEDPVAGTDAESGLALVRLEEARTPGLEGEGHQLVAVRGLDFACLADLPRRLLPSRSPTKISSSVASSTVHGCYRAGVTCRLTSRHRRRLRDLNSAIGLGGQARRSRWAWAAAAVGDCHVDRRHRAHWCSAGGAFQQGG